MAMLFFSNSILRDLFSSSCAVSTVLLSLPFMLGYSFLSSFASPSQNVSTTSMRPFRIRFFHPPESAGGIRRSLATLILLPAPVDTLDVATLFTGKTQSMFRPVPVM